MAATSSARFATSAEADLNDRQYLLSISARWRDALMAPMISAMICSQLQMMQEEE